MGTAASCGGACGCLAESTRVLGERLPESPTALAVLERSAFFLHLTPEQLRDFCHCFVMRTFRAGHTIAEEGDAVDQLYVVGSGEVVLHVHAAQAGRGSMSRRLPIKVEECAESSENDPGGTEFTSVTRTHSMLSAAAELAARSRENTPRGLLASEPAPNSGRRSVFHPRLPARALSRSSKTVSIATDQHAAQPGHFQGAAKKGLAGRQQQQQQPLSGSTARADDKGGGRDSGSDTERRTGMASGAEDPDEQAASSVHASDQSAARRILGTQKKGGFFGHVGLLSTGVKRLAYTAQALVKCTCAVVSREALLQYMNKHLDAQRRIRAALADSVERRLRAVPLLQGVSDPLLQVLAAMLHHRTLRKKEVLFQEGADGRGDGGGHSLFIVYAGTLVAYATASDNTRKVLTTFRAGDFFGEISLLVNIPRTAAVRATERCLLLELLKEDFDRFLQLEGTAQVAENMRCVLKQRVVEHFRKFKVPFWTAIPERHYGMFADLSSLEQLDAGCSVFREGDEADAFYMIVYGVVSVSLHKPAHGGEPAQELELAQLYAGKYFGVEVLFEYLGSSSATQQQHFSDQLGGAGAQTGSGLLVSSGSGGGGAGTAHNAHVVRRTSATAATKCLLVSITRQAFQRFFAVVPEALAAAELEVSKYDVSLSSLLRSPEGLNRFRMHLETEHSLENLDFFMEASAFFEMYAPVSRRSYMARGKRRTAESVESSASALPALPALPGLPGGSTARRQTGDSSLSASLPPLPAKGSRRESANSSGSRSGAVAPLPPGSESTSSSNPSNAAARRSSSNTVPSSRRGTGESLVKSDAETAAEAQRRRTARSSNSSTPPRERSDPEHHVRVVSGPGLNVNVAALRLGRSAAAGGAVPSAKMIKRAGELVRLYVQPGAPHQINIGEHTRSAILKTFVPGATGLQSGVSFGLFEDARRDIIALMETDSFLRFKQSPLFRDFLEDMEDTTRKHYAQAHALKVGQRQGSGTSNARKFSVMTARDRQELLQTRLRSPSCAPSLLPAPDEAEEKQDGGGGNGPAPNPPPSVACPGAVQSSSLSMLPPGPAAAATAPGYLAPPGFLPGSLPTPKEFGVLPVSAPAEEPAPPSDALSSSLLVAAR